MAEPVAHGPVLVDDTRWVADPDAQNAYVILALLWLVYLIHGFDRTVMYILLQPISVEFGLTDSQIGFVSGVAYAVPFALAGIPLGALADRVVRKRLLAALVAIWSAATLAASMAVNFATLLVVRATVGASEGGAPPTMLSLISDGVDPARRPRLVGALMTGPYAGLMLGSLVGGLVAGLAGWRPALLVAGVPGLILALVLLAFLREPRRGLHDPAADAGRAPSIRQAVAYLFAAGERAFIFLALAVSAAVQIALQAFMPLFLMREHGIPIAESGSIMAGTLGLCGAIGTFGGGFVISRIAGTRTSRALVACGVTLVAALPFSTAALFLADRHAVVAALGAWALLASAYIGPIYSAMIGLLPPRSRGTVMGMVAVLANLVGALGPQVVGIGSDALTHLGDPHALRHALLGVTLFMPLQAVFLVVAARFLMARRGCGR